MATHPSTLAWRIPCIEETSVQFSSVAQSCPTLCDPLDCSTAGLSSITDSWSLLKLMSIESVMPSNCLILCRPLLLLPLFSEGYCVSACWVSFITEISPEYSLEGLMLKLKLQYFGYLIRRIDSFEKTLMLERLKAGGEGDNRG